MMDPILNCAVPGCGTAIRGERPLCSWHWARLPLGIRAQIAGECTTERPNSAKLRVLCGRAVAMILGRPKPIPRNQTMNDEVFRAGAALADLARRASCGEPVAAIAWKLAATEWDRATAPAGQDPAAEPAPADEIFHETVEADGAEG